MIRRIARALLEKRGVRLKTNESAPPDIPDGELYRPFYAPWLGGGEFPAYYAAGKSRAIASMERCYAIYSLLRQAVHLDGDVWECGVYAGGTAAIMAAILRDKAPEKKLYLFDTFEGMPETDSKLDLHKQGDFANTSAESVAQLVGASSCVIRKGFIPTTFAGLESARICFAHIDVDIYRSHIDCLEFIWPRVVRGGFLLFDDYGMPTCPGARTAVDEFFAGRSTIPFCLANGQAIAFKSDA